MSPSVFDVFRERLRSATDCFVFCHGWLNDQAEAREGAERFFGHLDEALRPLGDRVVPLRVAIHWPSKPFAAAESDRRALRAEPALEPIGSLGDLVRRERRSLARLLPPLCEAEVPLGPEEELELDALVRQASDGASRGGMSLAPLHALSFWLMKRRAGQVGERLGRELLAPAFTALGDRAPRVHLVGHSFGAKLATSAVLGGLRPAQPGAAPGGLLGVRVRRGGARHEAPGVLSPRPDRAHGGRADRGPPLRARPRTQDPLSGGDLGTAMDRAARTHAASRGCAKWWRAAQWARSARSTRGRWSWTCWSCRRSGFPAAS